MLSKKMFVYQQDGVWLCSAWPAQEASMSTTAAETNPATALERKRVLIYKAFLLITIVNNLLIATYCLAFGGGTHLAQAPAWSVVTLGVLGLLTALFSVAALAWRRWGIYGIVWAGVAAALVAAAVKLFAAMAAFIVGTAFLLLIARHQWSHLR
jgi:hypothetical protein